MQDDDLDFALDFAATAGRKIVRVRTTTGRRRKLDRTDVTDADEGLNAEFIQAVRRREGRTASVKGEERSDLIAGSGRVWTIDTIDGTGEYVDDSVPDVQRTACIAISLFVNGRLMLAVVRNPFRNETFTARAGGMTRLNGWRIRSPAMAVGRGTPYDYCYWEGARFDVRGLERSLGKPRGVYSAIYQACEVAAGRSAFAVFPGSTIHDIAPGALIVARNGRVTDLRGRPLKWNDLTHGVLYANRAAHQGALRAIAAL